MMIATKTLIKVQNFCFHIKDTLKALDDYKNKQQNCTNQCFLICKCMYILKVYSIQHTLR